MWVVLRELVMYSPVRVDVGQGFAVAFSAILTSVSFGVGYPDQLSGTSDVLVSVNWG